MNKRGEVCQIQEYYDDAANDEREFREAWPYPADVPSDWSSCYLEAHWDWWDDWMFELRGS